MPEKSHWPFGEDVGAHGGKDARRLQETEQEKARLAEQAAIRQRMRTNRLIVGGRAHTKKRGLS